MLKRIGTLKRIALIVFFVWTIIAAALASDLFFSSKENVKKRATEEASAVITYFLTISDWLVKNSPVLERNIVKDIAKIGGEKNRQKLNEKMILVQMDVGSPEVFLILVKKDLNFQTDNYKLENWQNIFIKQLMTSGEAGLFIDEVGKEEFVRALEPIVMNNECAICKLFNIKNIEQYIGGIFVSVAISTELSQSYSHIWNMVGSIFVIWLLGLAAIIYGYKKASSALARRLRNYEESIYNLVDIIEKRDSYTAGHTQRVAKYASLIANHLKVSQFNKDLLYRASMLHDIGKISTPDSILLKPGKLNELEYKIIKNHVTTSYEILSKVSIYKDIAEIVRHHHEYYDGSGYPQALKGDQIPFLSQILTVADGFDAMTTDRIYKARKTVSETIAEISQLSGHQFNPVIVKSAIVVLSKVNIDDKVAQLPESDLQHERFSYFYKDNLTHAYNKKYLELLLTKQPHKLAKYKYALLIKVHNFTQYNAQNSWEKGDEKLQEIVSTLQAIGKNQLVFRLFGDDFILLLNNRINSSQKDNILRNEVQGTCLLYSTCYVNLKNRKPISIKELESLVGTKA
tara:strand:- start:23268 stop:24983 length:1716 start_codon:yes stop_codon:yes gene_type:complete